MDLQNGEKQNLNLKLFTEFTYTLSQVNFSFKRSLERRNVLWFPDFWR